MSLHNCQLPCVQYIDRFFEAEQSMDQRLPAITPATSQNTVVETVRNFGALTR